MTKKLFFIFILCMFFIIPPYQGIADILEKNYKWIKEPSYEYENIDRFDITNIPIEFGYTANGLYGVSVIEKNSKYNVIDYDGNLLFKDFLAERPDILDICEEGTFSSDYLKYDMYGNFIGGMQITGYIPFFASWNEEEQVLGYNQIGDTYIEITFEEAEQMEGNLYIIQEAENIYVEGGTCAFASDEEYIISSWCVSTNDKFGVVKDKKILIYPKYDYMYKFHDNMAAIKIGGKWGFINDEGKEVIKPQYDSVASFVHGYAPVESNGKFAYIDKMGNNITDFVFEKARPLDIQSGYAWVKKDNKWGIIQINGIEEDTSILAIKDWRQVYTNYLDDTRWLDSNIFSFEGIEFCLLDIDKNGTPELIFQNNNKEIPENEWCVYVISYDGKKSWVEKLETGYGKFYGYDEQKQLLKITKTDNDKDFKVYALENNKLIQKFNKDNIDSNSMLYKINDSNIIDILLKNE